MVTFDVLFQGNMCPFMACHSRCLHLSSCPCKSFVLSQPQYPPQSASVPVFYLLSYLSLCQCQTRYKSDALPLAGFLVNTSILPHCTDGQWLKGYIQITTQIYMRHFGEPYTTVHLTHYMHQHTTHATSITVFFCLLPLTVLSFCVPLLAILVLTEKIMLLFFFIINKAY